MITNIEVPKFKFALREDLKNMREFLPTKGEPNATGWDVKAAWETHNTGMIYEGEYVMIPLGFRVHIPTGWWLKLNPRSSTFAKKHLHSLYGVIDQDYSKQCFLCVHLVKRKLDTTETTNLAIKFGEALGQLIPVRREEMLVEEVSNEEFDQLVSDRNAVRKSGFGSTDVR